MIWTKFYKNYNISINTNGKLTKSVSNFRKFNNPSNELSLKWKYRLVGHPWRVLIAKGRLFEENYRRGKIMFKINKHIFQELNVSLIFVRCQRFVRYRITSNKRRGRSFNF